MKIPLNEFEQHIDESILKRGLSYLKKGHVHEPLKISPGEYEVIVEGTENYTVRLTLNNDVITEHVCNCPYDKGPVCKHVAAVIFYFLQDELELNKKKKRAPKSTKAKAPKRKTIAQQVDELLEKTSHDELKGFLREKAKENKAFRNMFMSYFARHSDDQSKQFYENHLKSILNAAKDRHGMIWLSPARVVNSEVSSLLESAQKQMDKRNFETAVNIITAVMEQMTAALQFSEDSNGDIGGCVYEAYDMLDAVVQEKDLPEESRKMILDYCFSAFDKKTYEGWDWHIGVLRLASMLVKTEPEIDRIMRQADQIHNSDWDKEAAQNLMHQVLLHHKSKAAANQFVEQNITNHYLRKKAIANAIDNKDYEKARKLAQDGVEHDMKDKPGLAKQWYDWLLVIAQNQNDTEKIIEHARYLFIDNFQPEQDYYQILKEHVQPEKWGGFVEDLVRDMEAKSRWLDTDLIADIYIREEWWDKLLALVKKSYHFSTIEYYEKYLKAHYADEIVGIYAEEILRYMEHNMGRKHYQKACRYLRRMIKLGGREQANEVISQLRTKYSNRKALLEELERV